MHDGPAFDEADDTSWPEDISWGSPGGWRTSGMDPDWLDTTADDPCAWWLGTHMPNWAWNGEGCGPLFISVTRLRDRKRAFPRAQVPIALDSGGFTEVTTRGGWTVSAEDYVAVVRRAVAELGTVMWAAIQDWMCEDAALQSTGLTIEDHQRLTIESYRELTSMAPEVRWLPVLQGQTVQDYLRHVDDYRRAGIELRAHQLVGLGSVCRRQATEEISEIVRELAARGLRLHGFGIKAMGLAAVGDLLRSADSLAWSYSGRKRSHAEGVVDSRGRALNNSSEYAEMFRSKMLAIIERDGVYLTSDGRGVPRQLVLPIG